ncbi:glutaredoxin family protein [Aquibacillus koreensis]|uniref:Glutaredoxin family protein n=1 Tax=Aquibacillus koreensis TaxID=279446 RepID=A0A9X3WRP4_9BACI|nr:glutaredoxin family protein [Aquibacillus koreensis]MCT2534947.1 glutaredoxin family protein [Aquibacillus koreensis]MDC3422159.1 glutaredoxin family protein [Aquibacillus koreensis]
MNRHNVIVYTSNSCQECEKVLSCLDELGITYTEKNISEDHEYRKELQKEKVYATPAVFYGKQVILGYQKQKLIRALG